MHCFLAASGLHLYDKQQTPSLRFITRFVFVALHIAHSHATFYACTWSSHSQLHTCVYITERVIIVFIS